MNGRAVEMRGEEKKKVVKEWSYPVEKYWSGIEDPDFVVYRIIPEEAEYIRPGGYHSIDVTALFVV